MIRTLTAILLTICATTAVAAQETDDEHTFRIGNDAYFTGDTVTVTTPGLDSVFAAGQRITLDAPLAHSAHLAGHNVNVTGNVTGDLYAAGTYIAVGAPVTGSASLIGYDITVGGGIGGNLRAAGSDIIVNGPVAGTALLAGESVAIHGVIEGDTAIGTEELIFGPDAKINGRLALYGEDADELAVPASVIPADRIDRHPDLHQAMMNMGPNWWTVAGSFVLGFVLVGLFAAIVAVLAPAGLEELRRITGSSPFRTLFIGFLALSTLLGSAIVLGLTLVGLVLAPVILLLAVLLCLLGHLIAIYLLGRMVLARFGQLVPDTFPERFFTGLTGAVLIFLLALVPILGWLIVYLLTLVGIGAFSIGVFRPEFRP